MKLPGDGVPGGKASDWARGPRHSPLIEWGGGQVPASPKGEPAGRPGTSWRAAGMRGTGEGAEWPGAAGGT
jgi:hypothetical protein